MCDKSEIFLVPKSGQGHLFPSIELSNHLTLRNFHVTFIVNSDDHDAVTSSIPPSLLQSSLFQLHTISSSSSTSPPSHPLARLYHQMAQGIESLLLSRRDSASTRPVCAVIDHIMNKTQEVFWKFDVPTVTFITSGACWAAVQHAAWVVRPADMRTGEKRVLPGLPEELFLSYSDLKQRRHWLPPALRASNPPEVSASSAAAVGGGGGLKLPRGPPLPGEPAPWVEEVENASAILINTCDDLERPFLDYIANLTRKPVWGVGPLLPEKFWMSSAAADSVLLRDQEIRPERESNYSEQEIIEWLDSKPRGSVIYVSFGSEVSPPVEEYSELASALGESTRPFIWVIQKNRESNYFPHGLDDKVGKRGLIIHGWAPQLLILGHPSTGGFVSHCGWNSTVEAIVRGIPILAWPIRGDQYYNAKLVVHYLKVGSLVCEEYPADSIKKVDIIKGIEKVLGDEEIRKSSRVVCQKFEDGFPKSSLHSLISFGNFIKHKGGHRRSY